MSRDITIYKNEKEYCSFPLLDYHSDNEIYISFFVAPTPDHMGIYDRKVMVSKDKGETWTETTTDKTGLNWKFGVEAPRELYDCYSWKDYNGDLHRNGCFGFKKDYNNTLEISWQTSHMSLIKSKVLPYAEIKNIPIPYIKYMFSFPRVLAKNNLVLIPMYAITKENKNKPFVYRTYYGDNPTPHQMFPDSIEGSECAFVSLIEDKILALIRADEKLPGMLMSISDDNGKTWSYPTGTRIPNGTPHLITTNNGEIICTSDNRNYMKKDTITSVMVFSLQYKRDYYDWKLEDILFKSRGYPSSLHKKRKSLFKKNKPDGKYDMGYPVTIQFSDGEILTAFYATKEDGVTHISGTKWRIL